MVVRQTKAVPLLQSLHRWAIDLQQQTLPSGKFGEALAYLDTQWENSSAMSMTVGS